MFSNTNLATTACSLCFLAEVVLQDSKLKTSNADICVLKLLQPITTDLFQKYYLLDGLTMEKVANNEAVLIYDSCEHCRFSFSAGLAFDNKVMQSCEINQSIVNIEIK